MFSDKTTYLDPGDYSTSLKTTRILFLNSEKNFHDSVLISAIPVVVNRKTLFDVTSLFLKHSLFYNNNKQT